MAVIPSFQPDTATLAPLVRTLIHASVPVLVSDDASPCTADPVLAGIADLGASVDRHTRNAGIARGLNDGLRFAIDQAATWLLTLDQDSAIDSGYVKALTSAANAALAVLGPERLGAVSAGIIGDASGELGYPVDEEDGVTTTAEVIQTGTLWSVTGLQEIGGFDESFGIDAVDAAACVRLRATGRRLVVVPDLAISHRIGAGRQVTLLGRTVMATGHSPERRTTIVRNRLRLAPEEFRQSPLQALRSLRRVAVSTALAVTVEEDRWAKAKAGARGLLPRRDG